VNGAFPFETGKTPEGELVLTFRVPLSYEYTGAVWQALNTFFRKNKSSFIIFDLAHASRIDSAGIALLRAIQSACRRYDIGFRFESVPPATQHFLEYTEQPQPPEPPAIPITPRYLISRLGAFVLQASAETGAFIRFVADFINSAATCIRNFRRFRWAEMFYYLQLSGANAMTIVFLVSLLLGLVMAFQAAIQLRQFGASIYVADLVSLALARELAPVFTAMILAGRSGSAFAAEIGTMKFGEELDALAVMGFDLTEFITVPKIFALMISGPLLTMLSNFAGILGGTLVGVVFLDISVHGFLSEMHQVLGIRDIVSGLIKIEVFAVLVGLIGCFRGFQTGTGADSIGRQTTSAVVSGLFMIIFADAVFTIFFNAIGW